MALALALATVVPLAAAAAPEPSVDVDSYANDTLNTGWYPDQPNLNPSLVRGGTFGEMFDSVLPDHGNVFAQPVVHDGTLLVATEKNDVCGLDPQSGAVRWGRNLGTPFNPADVGCGDLLPDVGITSTPTVDPATGTAYVVAKSYVSGSGGPARHQLHAISVVTGAERPGFPVTIGGQADNDPGSTFGTASANSLLQWAGLTIVDGAVYIAFAGHCDYAGQNAFQGWMFGVGTSGSARSGQVTARWTSEVGQGPNPGAGIWQSGGALVSDGSGQLLLATGNGNAPTHPTAGNQPPGTLGQSVVRLSVQADGKLRATDFFATYDAARLNSIDGDLGSGAPMALPTSYQGTPLFGTAGIPHLAVQVGKEGYVYLLNRDDLGGFAQTPGGGDAVVNRVGPDGGV